MVTVDGSNSSLIMGQSGGNLYIGQASPVTVVNITNYALVSNTVGNNTNTHIGYSVSNGASSTGTVTVSNSATLDIRALTISYNTNGDSSLHVLQGGTVNITSGTVGNAGTGINTVTVDGTNSKFSATSLTLAQGANTRAEMTVLNGGSVNISTATATALILTVGNGAGSSGTLTVGKDGTMTTQTGYIVVASNNTSSTGLVKVENGGKIVTTGPFYYGGLYIGRNNNGGGGTVIVDGTGSSWTVMGTTANGANTTASINIADYYANSSGTLIISNGGYVAADHSLLLGGGSNGISATLLFGNATGTATGGTLNLTGSIYSSVTASSTAQIRFNQTDTVSLSNNISGRIDIIQSGSGHTTLGGATTYTGKTIISGGTLAIANSIANSPEILLSNNATLDVSALGSGTFTVGSAQTLSGSGIISGDGKVVTVVNGTMNPDGELTFTNGLTVSPNATLKYTTDDTVIVMGGMLTLGTDVKLDLSGVGYYTLFNYAGATLSGIDSWLLWDLGIYDSEDFLHKWWYLPENDILALEIMVVPEPGTWAMILAGLGTLAGIQRLRRRR